MDTKKGSLSRREMLRLAGAAAVGAVVAACGATATPTAAPTPTARIVEVTKVVEKPVTQVVEKQVTQVVEKIVQVTPTPAPRQPVTIRFMLGWPGNAYFKLDEFGKTNPYIKTAWEDIGTATFEQAILMRVAAGNPPEIAWVKAFNTWDLVQAGALRDITPLIDKSPHPNMADINQTAMEYYNSPKGFPPGFARVPPGQYAWGGYIVWMLCVYNKTLLDKAKVPYPQDGWTWSDFRAAMQKVTALDKKYTGMVWPKDRLLNHNWLYTNGGDIYDAKGKCTLNAPEAIEAYQFVQDTIKSGIAVAEGATAGVDAFHTGNVAFYFNGMWSICSDEFQMANKESIGWVILPMNKAKAALLGCDAFGFLVGAKNPDAAWEYAKWMTGVECQKLIADADEVEVISVNKKANADAYTSKTCVTCQGAEGAKLAQWVLGTPFSNIAKKSPYVPTGIGFNYDATFQRIMAGEPVATVLNDAAKMVDSLNAQGYKY